jgi:hypothetical protein
MKSSQFGRPWYFHIHEIKPIYWVNADVIGISWDFTPIQWLPQKLSTIETIEVSFT